MNSMYCREMFLSQNVCGLRGKHRFNFANCVMQLLMSSVSFGGVLIEKKPYNDIVIRLVCLQYINLCLKGVIFAAKVAKKMRVGVLVR